MGESMTRIWSAYPDGKRGDRAAIHHLHRETDRVVVPAQAEHVEQRQIVVGGPPPPPLGSGTAGYWPR